MAIINKYSPRQTARQLSEYNPGRHVVNGYRILTLPLGQLVMAVGVFPGQFVSQLMKLVKKLPVIKNHVGPIAKTFGVGRTAYQIWSQDYLKSKETFIFHPTPRPQDTSQLVINENGRYQVPYLNSFKTQLNLETYSFEHENFKHIPPEEQYYRIHAPGNNGSCGRFFSEMSRLSRARPELKTITYNHPGVEGSTGMTMSQDDLINALCTQVKTLLKRGVRPENIEVTGFSIGAATAALAAEKLLDEGYEVNLFCGQTFAHLSAAVTHNLPIIGRALKFLKGIPLLGIFAEGAEKMIEWLIIKPLLVLTNWDMQPSRAYARINPDRKALTFVKPKTKGQGFWKKLAKFIGKNTGFFKEKQIDKIIPAHISLAKSVNLNGPRKEAYKKALQNLYDPSIRQRYIDRAHQASDNAISRNALKRLHQKMENKKSEPAGSTQLINLAILGWKGRRMEGVVKKDAHNVLAHDLPIRDVKNSKWLAAHQDNFNQLAQSALEASGGEHDTQEKLSALTYYTLFHDAVKNHNRILRKAAQPLEQKQEKGAPLEQKEVKDMPTEKQTRHSLPLAPKAPQPSTLDKASRTFSL